MKKGFTLIELLAVIVILAIIALIATPIVLNIINDTKESAVLRSADFYLDGVEKSIATSILKGISIKDGTYSIMKDGNVCIGTLESNTCTGDILKVEMDGEMPTEGTIKIKDGKIYKIELTLSNVEVWKDLFTGKLEYKLAPGLYDDNDKLLASWDELNEKAIELTGDDFTYIIESGDMNLRDNLFDSIEGESKLVIDDSIKTIGEYAFASSSLKEIIIPNSVTTIGDYAFLDCSLTKVVIPNSVVSMGSSIFEHCISLTDVIIEEGITNLGSRMFGSCEKLESIILPDSLVSIPDDLFMSCTNLKSITIPNSVTSIGIQAFMSCTNLKSITIPNSVTGIKSAAFAYSGLTNITILNNGTNIEEYVFDNCNDLETIYYKGIADLEKWGAPNTTVVTDF